MSSETPSQSALPPTIDPHTPSVDTIRRLRRLFAVRPVLAYSHAEQWICRRLAHNGLIFIRFALGIIFLWFGLLKFMPRVTAIDKLAERVLVLITFHQFRPEACLHTLALFECIIGIGMLSGRLLHLTILLLFLQMPGTFLPLVLLPHETWIHFPWFPTFEGQYILKNFALIAAGLIVASTIRGGKIIANPLVAAHAERLELEVETRAFLAKESTIDTQS